MLQSADHLHADCLAEIIGQGGAILFDYAVGKSFSGDGLIVASFYPEDRNIILPKIFRIKAETSRFGAAMLVSYAQNFEDVMLWRALKHVEHGFYVDIGAQDSVSLAFYEKGWRGVHVEPCPAYAAKLRDARRDEDVMEAAIAPPGRITLFEIPDTGLSTGRAEIAQLHADSGFASKAIEVTGFPLSELFARYPGREIHWLKIDVEGMENAVIASWQPSTTRPWVVVVVPRSQRPDYERWEPNLLALGYMFVYSDGLNRFYVHHDHEQLCPASTMVLTFLTILL